MRRLKLDVKDLARKLDVVSKDLVTSSFVGGYKSVFMGRGLEFEKYREYTSGDDSRIIDWKATMRANKTLVKEFVEERSLDVFFLFDVSDSMVFGSTKKLKNVYAAEFIASLAYAMIQAEDSVGIAIFNKDIIKFSMPLGGLKQYYNVLNVITDLDLYGGGYDITKSLEFAIRYLNDGALLIIVSDFVGLHDNWSELLKICGEKFQLIGVMVRDPLDRSLPDDAGQVYISNPDGEKKIIIEPRKIREAYETYAKQQEREVKDTFREAKGDFIELITDKPFVESIITFFKGRLKK